MVMKRLIAGALSSAIVMMAGAAGAQDLKIALIYSKTGPLEAYADRKSTRLNSSHSQISYAVFCLKKKTTRDIKLILRSIFHDVTSYLFPFSMSQYFLVRHKSTTCCNPPLVSASCKHTHVYLYATV